MLKGMGKGRMVCRKSRLETLRNRGLIRMVLIGATDELGLLG